MSSLDEMCAAADAPVSGDATAANATAGEQRAAAARRAFQVPN